MEQDLLYVYALQLELGGLEVPKDEIVFFDMQDWNKVVQLKYIGETEGEESAFQQELKARGLLPADVMLTNFYPELKQMTLDSWQRLFRHQEALKRGEAAPIHSLQAGLWCIRREWVIRRNGQETERDPG